MVTDNLVAKTPSAYDFPLMIRHLLHTARDLGRGREIVFHPHRRSGYSTFLERIARLASGLAAAGVRPGDTVAVMDWDSDRYLECFFAVPMMGAVLHTVNIRLSPEQILYTINHAEDDVILVHDEFAPILEQIGKRIERDVLFIRLSDGGATQEHSLPFEAEYEELLAGGDPAHQFEDFDENTRATTFYTTGTTGAPKGVYFSHRQLVLHTIGFMAALGWNGGHARFHRDDVYMPITPMFHVHGWGIPYIATTMGVKQVYPGKYLPEKLLESIDREGVTFSHCVPTILHMLLSHPLASEVDLSRWKVIIGGSTMPMGLGRRALELGIDIFSAYGMSEACPLLTVAQLEKERLDHDLDGQLHYRSKTGRPTPLVEIKVIGEDGGAVPWDGSSAGEIVARAPWLTQGYLKDPERSEELWRDGYLHTGDIANIDAEGYLMVTDRLKDVIKSGGEWISSIELEGLVSRIDGVGEVAAVGVPDEKWGERPLVLVVPAVGHEGDLTEDMVKAELDDCAERGVISRWAVPDRVLIVEEIAKTSVGKIDKKGLREKYGAS